jgi:hypothetical protein
LTVYWLKGLPEMTAKNNYAQDERIMAALAHGSIIAGQMGIIASIAVYLNQKDKSVYAARQAVQAAVYQIAGFIAILIGWGCWTGFYFLTFIPLISNPAQYDNSGPPPLFWAGMLSMICPFLLMALWFGYGLYAAIQTWLGKDFKYAVIGNLVEQRLGKTAV